MKISLMFIFFGGSERSDKKLTSGAISDGAKRLKVRDKVSRPAKLAFATALERSTLAKAYKKAINRLIYTPVSTFGAYLVTLGIYMGLIFFVRLYAFDNEAANVYRLANGAVLVVLSLPLLFVGKPLVRFMGDSAFFGRIFSDCIDLDSYTEPKKSAAVGSAIVFGSLSGVLAFFCGEEKILLLLAATVFGLIVLYSPELGVCSAVFAFPFVSKAMLIGIIDLALFSYTVKVLRGKRNFKLSADGIFLLILTASFLIALIGGGGERAHFAFCMCALCLMIANLALTYKLLKKIINALCLGIGIAIIVFCYQIVISAWGGMEWKEAIWGAVSVFENGNSFAEYFLLVLPFLFCKSGRGSLLNSPISLIATIGGLAYCVVTERLLLAILMAAAAALYLTVNTKRLFGPIITCFGIPIGGLYFASIPITFGTIGAYEMVAGWAEAVKIYGSHLFSGVGMSWRSLELAGLGDSHSMYLQSLVECGITGFILLLLALFFIVQRFYASLSPTGSEGRRIASAASTAALTGLLLGLGNNLWNETDACFVLWMALGLVSAAYKVRIEEKRGTNDEEI